jgi:hypothetical protein
MKFINGFLSVSICAVFEQVRENLRPFISEINDLFFGGAAVH